MTTLPARRRTSLLLAVLVVVVSALFVLVGPSSGSTGTWNLFARIQAGSGPVIAAQAGGLALSLRNVDGTILARVGQDASSEASLSQLAAGQALVVWTAPTAGGGGQNLVGVARSDAALVSVLLSDGTTTTLSLDSLNAFSYSSAHAQVLNVRAINAAGLTVGEITVPPTGSPCVQSVCRALANNTRAANTAAGSPVYGIFSSPSRVKDAVNFGGAITLRRLNARTLAPVGRKLNLPAGLVALAFSPDGTQLLATTNDHRGLSIIDLAHMTVNAKLQARLAAARGSAVVKTAAWPTADRVLLVAQRMSEPYQRHLVSRTLLALDPADGSIVWKRELTHKLTLGSSGTVGNKLVLLLGSSSQSYPGNKQRVVVASADGEVHTSVATIPYVKHRVGQHRFGQGTLVVTTGASPAAYIVAPRTVFSIDLDTAQATPHPIALPKGAPKIAPDTDARIAASALGDKLVAGGGLFPRADDQDRAGIYLVDPRTWTARLIDRKATRFVTRGDTLVTFNTSTMYFVGTQDPPAAGHGVGLKIVRPTGTGITIYDRDGTRLHHLYDDLTFTEVALTPTFAYAFWAPTPTSFAQAFMARRVTGWRSVFDPATGKSLDEITATSSSPRLLHNESP